MAVHNSHAAAYGLVAYQTAYFKANYPVEFMAALLTSEMGDTDKIVKYIDECRAMGIRVEPPDVNVSAVQFSVAGDTVHFGLAAIKNVGEAAMQSILKARAEGPFRTLDDFCSRVDLRLVNRRVVESLLKAGAFDSLGLTRAHLLATADVALESGGRQQRDRAEGQGSFFELLPEAPARAGAPAEVIPEWEADQRLAFEKEVLGFYISGHPLARYREVVEPLGVTTSADLAAKGHGARVILFGHAAGLKETSTKGGNRMAFFTLEDMEGTVEVTVFPEPFKTAAACLRSGEAVLVRGRVDDGDKGRVVLAEDVRLLEQALAESAGRPRPGTASGEPSACRIRIAPGEDPSVALAAVRRICGEHPGRVPVFLHLLLDAQEVVVRARGLRSTAARSSSPRARRFSAPARSAWTMPDALDFEQPLIEIENRIAGLQAQEATQKTREEIAKLEDRLVRLRQKTYTSLTAWQRTQLARHPKRPAHARSLQASLRRLHRAPRRPRVRRRRRDRRRAWPGSRGGDRRGGPSEGARHAREDRPQLRDAASGGLPQGAPAHAAGPEVRQADRHVHRHARRLSRARRRGAQPGRGDRAQPREMAGAAGADRSRW